MPTRSRRADELEREGAQQDQIELPVLAAPNAEALGRSTESALGAADAIEVSSDVGDAGSDIGLPDVRLDFLEQTGAGPVRGREGPRSPLSPHRAQSAPKPRRKVFGGSKRLPRASTSSSGSSRGDEGSPRNGGRRRGRTASSNESASSKSSWGSILSSNMHRVHSISGLFSTRSARGSRSEYSDDDDDDDVSTDSEVGWAKRLLLRDRWFFQSSGELAIDQVGTRSTLREIFSLYTDDWFHRVLTQHTAVVLLGVAVMYTVYLLLFAAIYWAIRDPESPTCALSPSSDVMAFQMAFAFALETAATSGYGLPDDANTSFWRDCVRVPVVVWFQSWVAIILNAVTIGIVYMRIGRADARSHQVIFTDKACITYTDGQFHLSFQVYDLDVGQPIVEAHVRTYVVLNETDGVSTVNFQTRYMRLQNPNDELGSDLFLSVPCTVVHAIDQWSPLLPPSMRREHWVAHDDNFVHNAANRYQYPHMVLREADLLSGSRGGAACPVCGLDFATDEHLMRHIRYQQYMETVYFEDDEDEDADGAPSGQQSKAGGAASQGDADADTDDGDDDDDDEDGTPGGHGAAPPPGTHESSSNAPNPVASAKSSADPDADSGEQTDSAEDFDEALTSAAALAAASLAASRAAEAENPQAAQDKEQASEEPLDSHTSASSDAKIHQSVFPHAGSQSVTSGYHAEEDSIKRIKSAAPRLNRRESSFHSQHSIRSMHSHHSRHSEYYNTIRYVNSQKRLEQVYLNEIKRGGSKKIHHYTTVRAGRVAPTIDKQLKDLADLSRLVGHAGVDMDGLVTHDRVITQAERIREEEQLRERERERERRLLSARAGEDAEETGSHAGEPSRAGSSFHRKSKVVEDVRHKLRNFIDASELEIVVIVEGIEPSSSMTFQARHSYTKDDIVFDHWFAQCFGRDEASRRVVMNLDKFHETVPIPTDEDDLPMPFPVQSVL